jgi:hypothetical protein
MFVSPLLIQAPSSVAPPSQEVGESVTIFGRSSASISKLMQAGQTSGRTPDRGLATGDASALSPAGENSDEHFIP